MQSDRVETMYIHELMHPTRRARRLPQERIRQNKQRPARSSRPPLQLSSHKTGVLNLPAAN